MVKKSKQMQSFYIITSQEVVFYMINIYVDAQFSTGMYFKMLYLLLESSV